jgi:hypothetical protein
MFKFMPVSMRRAARGVGLTIFSVSLVAGAALGQAGAQRWFLNLGGQSYPVSVITVNGKSYVAADSLRAAGGTLTASAARAAGGSNQVSAVEGVLGQTLFNGVWRLTVKKVVKYTNKYGRPAVTVSYELKNGSHVTTDAPNTGFVDNAQSMFLVLSSGNTVPPEDFLDFSRDIPPGGAFNFDLVYTLDKSEANSTPVRVLAIIKPEKRQYSGLKVHYSVKDPSFRISLTRSQP